MLIKHNSAFKGNVLLKPYKKSIILSGWISRYCFWVLPRNLWGAGLMCFSAQRETESRFSPDYACQDVAGNSTQIQTCPPVLSVQLFCFPEMHFWFRHDWASLLEFFHNLPPPRSAAEIRTPGVRRILSCRLHLKSFRPGAERNTFFCFALGSLVMRGDQMRSVVYWSICVEAAGLTVLSLGTRRLSERSNVPAYPHCLQRAAELRRVNSWHSNPVLCDVWYLVSCVFHYVHPWSFINILMIFQNEK